MTSHEIRSTQNARNKISSEQNNLKKLKSKHSAKLPTLKVLFSEWSDDDLLFVLEEANGHANQWGEVKTKKSKKEAQKAKAATATISPHQTSSTITSYSPKPSTPSRPNNDRVNRSGKAPITSNRARKINSSWDNKQQDSSASFGGSWANIASTKGQNDVIDDSWNTSNTTDSWATSVPVQDNNEEDVNDDQPKTWASLLKSKPKTEAENVDTNEDEPFATQTHDGGIAASTDDAWNVPTTSNDGWNATSAAPNITTSASQEWNAASEQPVVDEWSTPVNVNGSSIKETPKEQEHSHEVSEVGKEEEKPSNNRLHNQEEPVVLPTSDIAELDVKFGSLHVEEESTEILVKETTVIEEETKESAVEAPSVEPSAPLTNTNNDSNFAHSSYLEQQEVPAAATNATSAAAVSANPAYQQQQLQQIPQQDVPQQGVPQQGVSQQDVPQQSIPQQGVPQQGIPQQGLPQQGHPQQGHPQQQPFGMDHLTSAYSSYLPNQHHTGASGFGMNPMGNVPDYSAYSTEAQRAAAAMGYYDPTAFNHHSPVTSSIPYQTRDKYTQETAGQAASAQSQTVPQQMYPTNLPYYQYYYMPNQYGAYQQSAYGQPFMNKSMYPNMYQHSSATAGKPATAAAAAAAAAAVQSPYSSPYGQQSQLYSQSMSGYDDLGLSDYQKSMYGQQQPQLQGFLGQLNQQQPAQGGSQPTQPAQKSDARSAAISSSAASQPPSGQQQTAQQQPLHHPYANNFFGQPQMFSYQQYPQYQQQMGHPQATATNRHQQQYWNQ
ncbi:unnamed protein product [Rhizopus stolonifer]